MTTVPGFVPVVIVGGGPTGITAATILAQRGVECLVLDRWPGVYPQPRAVHLDDECFRLIASLGIGDEFAAISRPALGLQFRDPDLGVMAQITRPCTNSTNGYPQANMFDQPELEQLLRRNLQSHPTATLRTDSEVTAVAQTGSGPVRVSFTDRNSGVEHQVEARYVLGCDGAGSLVRAAVGATMEELNFQQRWLVVDVATEAELGQWEGVQQVCDPHRAATYMRIGADRYRWEFRLLPGERAEDFTTLPALLPLIGPWVSGVAPDTLSVRRVAEYTFRAQVADRWRRGGVFLLGDAAHLTPPFIGQGMCAGLRDAMNLGWKLAGVVNERLPEAVLDSYEIERKPHVRHLIRFAIGVGAAMTAGGRAGNLLRRLLVPRLHLVPGMKAKIEDSTTPALRGGALLVRTRRRRDLAGRLCPNSRLPDGRRLDEVAGRGFVIVTSKELTPAQCAEACRRGAAVVVTQPGTELAHWLRSGRAVAAVVRPDRTALATVRRVSEIIEFLPGFPSVDSSGNAERRATETVNR